MSGERAQRAMRAVIVLVALYVPCRFLLPLDANYYVDWNNHQWVIAYVGEHVRQHGWFPSELSTAQAVGMAAPVFYGTLLYPLLGLPAAVLSAGVVLRVAVVALFAAQLRIVARALLSCGVSRLVATAVGVLTIWAIYPLTNLYNRGALTELFATGLVVCALGLLVRLVHAADAAERRRHACHLGLALTVAAGAHPITALFAVPLFAVFVAAFWWLLPDDDGAVRRRAALRAVAPWLALAAVCTLPWLYATITYGDELLIRSAVPRVVVDGDGLDAWTTRFHPLAHDPRVVGPLDEVSTPYLDAQINLPLAILFVVLAGLALASLRTAEPARRRPIAAAVAIPAACFAFFTALSLSGDVYRVLPSVAGTIQFAYRAVTYQNLSLLLGVFLLAMVALPARALERPALRVVLGACLVLSAAGAIVKWSHIEAVQTRDGSARVRPTATQRRAIATLPPTYYGVIDYITPARFELLPAEAVAGAVAQGFALEPRDLGRAAPIELELPATSWVVTNALAFPWNRLVLDGRTVPASELRARDDVWLAVSVPPGRHRLEFRHDPDPVWRALSVISLVVLFAWCGYVLLAGVRRCLPSR